ncbi:SurA domain-containing protein [Clostridium aceticum]|uniref:SurA domain-containing protein n=1 Tax=Clostridium aceticum TaxID=84022 RepID=A0A0D8I979_9CLOT|nr:SurA N-terminal domain-containing protein [Clostridium aceticum]AKL93754.1 SurA domain-containing protein [Clostridium aceticum]KJF25796.1 hypothetical protein TZ02_16460 [Clostridium aceticum]
MLRKLFLIILSIVLLISVSACSSTDNNVSGPAEEEGAVVALVNDTEIQRVDFENMVENMKLSYQQFGLDFDSEESKEILELLQEEALNNLIQQQLLLQDAFEKNYTASTEEIAHEIEQIKAQFSSEEEFTTILETHQLTLESLEKSIADEIIISQYMENEIGDLEVSEEEIRALYDDYSEFMEDLAEFEEMRFELEEELKYQKFQTTFTELIETLKAQSNIQILL